MSEGPNVKGNPLRVVVILLVFSYVLGEFILPKFPILYVLKLIGILGLILSVGIFIAGFFLPRKLFQPKFWSIFKQFHSILNCIM